MASLPPWLNVSPQMFLQAAEAGGSAGLQVASMRQRALEADAARQAQADDLAARLEANATSAALEQEARRNSNALQSRSLDIRERQGMAQIALDRMAQQARAEEASKPLELRELRDSTGNRVGLGYGKNVRWDVPEIPTEGTPMVDSEGNVVANRFGPRVINVPRERALTQADIDMQVLQGLTPGAGQAGPSQAPASSGGRVMVKKPDGRVGTIPASRLEEALRNGYKLAR